MSVVVQAGHTSSHRSIPRSFIAPGCNHHRMDRVYGRVPCDTCRRESPLGWLYQCTQDVPEAGDYQFLKSLMHPKSDFGESLRGAGLSESVVSQAEQGVYTDEQIEILKAQKEKLRDAIQHVTNSPRVTGPNSGSHFTSQCQFRACQRCRPCFVDRCWMSFEAVFNDEIRPIDSFEDRYLPVKDARIVRMLGLRPQAVPRVATINPLYGDSPDHPFPSDVSTDGFSTNSDSCSETQEEEWSASQGGTTFVSQTFVSAQETQESFTPHRTIRLVPNTSTVSPARPLRRVSGSVADWTPTRSNTSVSSKSAPTTPTTSYTSLLEYEDESPSMSYIKALADPATRVESADTTTPLLAPGSAVSRSPTASSLGDEVDVAGGVALTEEAVHTQTPDLLTRT